MRVNTRYRNSTKGVHTEDVPMVEHNTLRVYLAYQLVLTIGVSASFVLRETSVEGCWLSLADYSCQILVQKR